MTNHFVRVYSITELNSVAHPVQDALPLQSLWTHGAARASNRQTLRKSSRTTEGSTPAQIGIPSARLSASRRGGTSCENYIQVGSFRFGVADFPSPQAHLSVGHGSATSVGMTCVVYQSDGAVHLALVAMQDTMVSSVPPGTCGS